MGTPTFLMERKNPSNKIKKREEPAPWLVLRVFQTQRYILSYMKDFFCFYYTKYLLKRKGISPPLSRHLRSFSGFLQHGLFRAQ